MTLLVEEKGSESAMTKAEAQAVRNVVAAVLGDDIYRATKYLAPNVVISAARVRFRKKIVRRERCHVVSVRIGAPNHAERDFIKRAVKAGEPFPVKRVQRKKLPARCPAR